MSLFITFEGIEGSGKSTQIALLAERLRARERTVLTTREPGGCTIADAVRTILLDARNTAMVPRAELLLYAAARAQHIEEVIRPALDSGTTVLCDRFADATLAYQGFGRGLDMKVIEELNGLATGGLAPDLTLLLDFPPEEGVQRALRRNDSRSGPNEDRFELESIAFHRRIREGYLELARREDRFRVVDARGSIDEVAGRIARAVDPVLAAGVRQ
ncbi:MAG: dTMP kinase [Desulfuromonas sp.]|uniref:dTMP kinase n=1 Tax=Desulfuromonas sp. TaxID=892 RepID=UPI000CCB7EEF|nr:dTMP kinase [Desulfuromonas sp.]PLX82583.1 MAG: dTMP kinase [Desulfuromonas sp.]